jgi:vesicle-fusing ATPase
MSNIMTLIIKTLIKSPPPKGHRLLILATTSRRNVLEQLGLLDGFGSQIAVPPVKDMNELNIAMKECKFLPDQERKTAIGNLRQYSTGDAVGVGIKSILRLAESATQVAEPADWFADQLGRKIAEANAYR